MRNISRLAFGIHPHSFSKSNPNAQPNTPEIPDLNKGEANKILTTLASGAKIHPKDIYRIISLGSDEERGAIRHLLTSDKVQAQNQDMNLNLFRLGMEGSSEAKRSYERQRFVLEENLPTWLLPTWKSEAQAPWRKADLHSQDVLRYTRKKFHQDIQKGYRFKSLPPLSESTSKDDRRAHFCTLFAMERFIEAMEKLSTRQALEKQISAVSSEALFFFAKREVETNFLDLYSPTAIGDELRHVALTEFKQMFAAVLIEDACVAYGLPLNENAKLNLWRRNRTNPWNLAQEFVITDREALFARGEENRSEAIDVFSAIFEAAALDPRSFRSQRAKSSPAIPIEAPHRLQVETSESAPPKVPEQNHKPVRNIRLMLQGVIEAVASDGVNPDLYARYLTKLVGNSEQRLSETLNAIVTEVDLDDIVLALREKRPLSTLHKRAAALEQEAFEKRGEAIWLDQNAPLVKPSWNVVYHQKTLKAFKDGQIRHAATLAIDRYIEKPELADKRKINATTNVWELRLHRSALRVYFFHHSPNYLAVIGAGSKNDQKQDVTDLEERRLEMISELEKPGR